MTPAAKATMRALIVDDEQNARRKVRALLKAYDWITVIGEARDGIEAVEQALKQRPDVLFLDIDMPCLDGFEVLEYLNCRELNPNVVFITAHDQFAMNAFDVHAVDYLLKPLLKDRFSTSMEKLQKMGRTVPEGLAESYREQVPRKQRLLVKTGNRFQVIPYHQIDCIVASEHLSEVWTQKGSYLCEDSLDKLEATLPTEDFFRIHRSALCRLESVQKLITDGKRHYYVQFEPTGHPNPKVTRRKYRELKERLRTLGGRES